MNRREFATGAAALALMPRAARAEDWSRYVNPRFGVAVDYPAGRFPDAPLFSDNGDGATFLAPDGRAVLKVWGANDVAEWRFSDMKRAFASDMTVTWSEERPGRWIVTGTDGASIRYTRCNRGGGVLACFEVTYPASEKSSWDAVVTRMSRSLRG